MFISHRLPTAYGYSLSNEPRGVVIPSDPLDALHFASVIDRRSDACLAEGRTVQAERLAHLAFEARARAMGGRA